MLPKKIPRAAQPCRAAHPANRIGTGRARKHPTAYGQRRNALQSRRSILGVRAVAGRIEARLAELGITLPLPMAPIANYVPYVVTGNLVVVSGQLPAANGKVVATGKVGWGVPVEQGKEAARLCFINVLVHLKAACGGDLDRVRRVVRLGGFIAASSDFTEHAQVMNGASDLAVAVFGEAGRHARSTIGVSSLPADAAVEVEGMFEID
jgi:enamine deaminase RidA (YjgF/YER057c/UK114 family)